ncbi:MAG TPA: DUF5916 domain-containing protein, partial [Gemmatimonadales bacterium]|nr:DUF5916 domain-containing protein [Gemmatimonadales bacterium]
MALLTLPLVLAALGAGQPTLPQPQGALAADTTRRHVALGARPGPGPAAAAPVRAARTPQPIALDGALTEPAWAQATVFSDFTQKDPNEGQPATQRTEVRVLYDADAIYVGADLFDTAPDSIRAQLARRDNLVSADRFFVFLDPYHDRRTGFYFGVNAAGTLYDGTLYNDDWDSDTWDGVWDAKVQRTDRGWSVEMRIPLSQLRFPKRDVYTWGVNFRRDIARYNENAWLVYTPKNGSGFVSRFRELTGLTGIVPPRRLEILPYATAKAEFLQHDAGDPFHDGSRYSPGVGADLKFGVSGNLTLDATINPDFGQVEADPAQLNLSAFETFYGERRPFFLEGAGIFKFNTNCGDIDSGCTGLFYSRRIGRRPQLTDDYGDATSPTVTPIATAAKLTGRLANGFSIGVLDAATERVDGVATVDGIRPAIEPRTNYSVLRVQRDHDDGRGDIGFMLTGVNRALDAGGSPYLANSAYSGGVDLRRRFVGNDYELRTFVAGSDVRGSREAIAALQSNNVHAFQRPDDRVAYDPTRTELRGDAERVSFSKFGGGITRFQSVYQRFSPGFETNDIGYQQRADQQLFRNWFSLQFQNPTKLYRKASLNFNAQERWSTDGLAVGNGLNYNMHLQLPSMWWVHLGLNANDLLPAYGDRDARGGPALRHSKSASGWTGFQTDDRNALAYSVFTSWWKGDDGHSWGMDGGPGVSLRVSSQFSASMNVNYSRNVDDGQFYESYGDVGSDTAHYTFARLDQTTVGMSSRVNFTATPNLS